MRGALVKGFWIEITPEWGILQTPMCLIHGFWPPMRTLSPAHLFLSVQSTSKLDGTNRSLPMADRYFSDEPISTDRVTLAGPEAHHLIHVMRAVPGMRVTLFDGGGDEFTAAIERVGRSEVELSILAPSRLTGSCPWI